MRADSERDLQKGNGWEPMRLDDIAAVRFEKVLPAPGDDRPYIGLEHIAQGAPRLVGVGLAGEMISHKTVFQAGDILFGKLRPALRKVVPVDFDGVCSTDILAIHPKRRGDGPYLQQLLHSDAVLTHALRSAEGTKMPRTSWGDLRRYVFLCPPARERQRISTSTVRRLMTNLDEALRVGQIAQSLAALAQAVADDLPGSTEALGGRDLAALIQDTELADVTLKLFSDGHYALAVEQAYKCVDRRVSSKSRISNSGQDLMFTVFSPEKPRLRLNNLKSTSDKDEQDGFKFIFGGCMRAIRNPRAHNHLFLDKRADALLMIAWADYLLRRVETAKVVRNKGRK